MGKVEYLKKYITRKNLLKYAGGRSFERGEEYFEDGAVGPVSRNGDTIKAAVTGNQIYSTTISADPGGVDYFCSCLYGQEGNFCKHCVALGLEWLGFYESGDFLADDDVAECLSSFSKEDLVQLIIENRGDGERFYNRVELKCLKKRGKGINMQPYQRMVEKAFEDYGIVEYYEVPVLVSEIQKVIEVIRDFVKSGFPQEAVVLYRKAISAGLNSMEEVDDVDGLYEELLENLAELHLVACQKADISPEEIAEWYLHTIYEEDENDVLYGANEIYEKYFIEKLGEETYQALLDEYSRL